MTGTYDTGRSRTYVATGEKTGTGSAITVTCGFAPAAVALHNVIGEALLFWNREMDDDKGYKINGLASGTISAPTVNTATPVFSGTGQASSGQVITTTDNQTMAVNACAGMWFVSATHGPYLIASNTAVAAAPAVLTIYGTAPTTDAGTYNILKDTTPVFTGGASDSAFISSGGITPTVTGFTIGTDTDVNVAAETIYWTAWRL